MSRYDNLIEWPPDSWRHFRFAHFLRPQWFARPCHKMQSKRNSKNPDSSESKYVQRNMGRDRSVPVPTNVDELPPRSTSLSACQVRILFQKSTKDSYTNKSIHLTWMNLIYHTVPNSIPKCSRETRYQHLITTLLNLRLYTLILVK